MSLVRTIIVVGFCISTPTFVLAQDSSQDENPSCDTVIPIPISGEASQESLSSGDRLALMLTDLATCTPNKNDSPNKSTPHTSSGKYSNQQNQDEQGVSSTEAQTQENTNDPRSTSEPSKSIQRGVALDSAREDLNRVLGLPTNTDIGDRVSRWESRIRQLCKDPVRCLRAGD